MKYHIFVTKEFESEFKKLDKNLRERVISKIRELEYNPELGKPLRYSLKGLRSLRVGKYRIIYKLLKVKTRFISLRLNTEKMYIDSRDAGGGT